MQRTSAHHRVRRGLAGVLAVLCGVQTILGDAAQASLWEERRQARAAAQPRPDAARVVRDLPDLARPTTLPAAAPALNSLPKAASDRFRPWLSALPPASGALRRVILPKDPARAPLVIHIQDVHQNLDAQKNIAAAVTALANAGAGLLALEGGAEPVAFEPFRAAGEPETVRKAADYFLEKGEITGPAHAAFTAPAGAFPPVVGVEDPVPYAANVAAYRRAKPVRAVVKERLAGQRRALSARKSAAYNPALKTLDAVLEAYHAEAASLTDYAEVLAPFSTRDAALSGFLAALRMEKDLDFRQVEADRERVIAALAARLSPNDLQSLVDQGLAYRSGAIRYAAFYSYLSELCRRSGVDLAATPAMDAYVRYVLAADRIDAEELFQALGKAEATAVAALARTDEERRLAVESRALSLKEKLADFALTPEEWTEYRRSPADPAMADFEAFYAEAQVRDEAIARNLLAEAARRAGPAVLVTGGFHAPGIDQKLAAAGCAVAVFVPRIDKVDGDAAAALDVFTREKTPLEKLFQGERLFLGQDFCPPQVRWWTAVLIRAVRFFRGRPVADDLPAGEVVFHKQADGDVAVVRGDAEVEVVKADGTVNPAAAPAPAGWGARLKAAVASLWDRRLPPGGASAYAAMSLFTLKDGAPLTREKYNSLVKERMNVELGRGSRQDEQFFHLFGFGGKPGYQNAEDWDALVQKALEAEGKTLADLAAARRNYLTLIAHVHNHAELAGNCRNDGIVLIDAKAFDPRFTAAETRVLILAALAHEFGAHEIPRMDARADVPERDVKDAENIRKFAAANDVDAEGLIAKVTPLLQDASRLGTAWAATAHMAGASAHRDALRPPRPATASDVYERVGTSRPLLRRIAVQSMAHGAGDLYFGLANKSQASAGRLEVSLIHLPADDPIASALGEIIAKFDKNVSIHLWNLGRAAQTIHDAAQGKRPDTLTDKTIDEVLAPMPLAVDWLRHIRDALWRLDRDIRALDRQTEAHQNTSIDAGYAIQIFDQIIDSVTDRLEMAEVIEPQASLTSVDAVWRGLQNVVKSYAFKHIRANLKGKIEDPIFIVEGERRSVYVNGRLISILNAMTAPLFNAQFFATKQRVKVILSQKEEEDVITVENDGRVPEELLALDPVTGWAKIFSYGETERAGGTGLGLAELRITMERLMGPEEAKHRVKVENIPGGENGPDAVRVTVRFKSVSSAEVLPMDTFDRALRQAQGHIEAGEAEGIAQLRDMLLTEPLGVSQMHKVVEVLMGTLKDDALKDAAIDALDKLLQAQNAARRDYVDKLAGYVENMDLLSSGVPDPKVTEIFVRAARNDGILWGILLRPSVSSAFKQAVGAEMVRQSPPPPAGDVVTLFWHGLKASERSEVSRWLLGPRASGVRPPKALVDVWHGASRVPGLPSMQAADNVLSAEEFTAALVWVAATDEQLNQLAVWIGEEHPDPARHPDFLKNAVNVVAEHMDAVRFLKALKTPSKSRLTPPPAPPTPAAASFAYSIFGTPISALLGFIPEAALLITAGLGLPFELSFPALAAFAALHAPFERARGAAPARAWGRWAVLLSYSVLAFAPDLWAGILIAAVQGIYDLHAVNQDQKRRAEGLAALLEDPAGRALAAAWPLERASLESLDGRRAALGRAAAVPPSVPALRDAFRRRILRLSAAALLRRLLGFLAGPRFGNADKPLILLSVAGAADAADVDTLIAGHLRAWSAARDVERRGLPSAAAGLVLAGTTPEVVAALRAKVDALRRRPGGAPGIAVADTPVAPGGAVVDPAALQAGFGPAADGLGLGDSYDVAASLGRGLSLAGALPGDSPLARAIRALLDVPLALRDVSRALDLTAIALIAQQA